MIYFCHEVVNRDRCERQPNVPIQIEMAESYLILIPGHDHPNPQQKNKHTNNMPSGTNTHYSIENHSHDSRKKTTTPPF